jgi:hypothetical protein
MSTPKAETKTPVPFEVAFSDKVKARYGYKDAHVELVVELPFPLSTIKKTYSEKFTADELKQLKEALDKAMMWASLPDFQRERDGV